MSEVKRYKDDSREASKYKHLDRIVYDTGEEIIETADRIVFEPSNEDEFWSVQAGFENRLDLISYKFYGSPLYWWAIAAASNIYNPLDVAVGTVLRIPPKSRVLGW